MITGIITMMRADIGKYAAAVGQPVQNMVIIMIMTEIPNVMTVIG